MTLEVEALIERRRLRRKVSLWRVLAIGAVALALAVASFTGGRVGGFGRGTHIARIDVSGLIVDDRAQLELLKKVGDNDSIAAVMLYVDSPGGTTTGGEALYEAVGRLAAKKPVVAVCGTIATSAAYMTAIATDRIFVRGNTITGSVGVIFQFPEVSGLLDKLGVRMYEIKSGSLKANPSMFQPLDAPGRALAEEMVAESKAWFVGLVEKRRKLAATAVPGLVDGRIFSGRQAVGLKLADEIGGETEAVAWLEGTKGIDKGLEVVDWKPKREAPFGLLGSLVGTIGGLFGGNALTASGLAEAEALLLRLNLDGFVSIWHVQ